jgi:hypothetical protein
LAREGSRHVILQENTYVILREISRQVVAANTVRDIQMGDTCRVNALIQ